MYVLFRMRYTRRKKIKGGSLSLMSIFLMCYNEERIIDFTVNYYKKQFPNCIITICDNESTDRSVKIAKKLGCKIHTYKTDGVFSETALMNVRNNIWKTASTPWVIVCDMDEILTANQKDILDEQKKGTTILKTKGYEIIGHSKKEDLSNIKLELDTITSGYYRDAFSKKICFDRTKITDTNFAGGSHTADPKGDVKYSEKEYLLYHYKKLGYEYYKFTHQRSQPRAKKAENKGIYTSSHYTLNDNVFKIHTDKSQIQNLESIPALKTFYLARSTR
jgi:glycosyltransferase involved in cell wall biosynthesis